MQQDSDRRMTYRFSFAVSAAVSIALASNAFAQIETGKSDNSRCPGLVLANEGPKVFDLGQLATNAVSCDEYNIAIGKLKKLRDTYKTVWPECPGLVELAEISIDGAKKVNSNVCVSKKP